VRQGDAAERRNEALMSEDVTHSTDFPPIMRRMNFKRMWRRTARFVYRLGVLSHCKTRQRDRVVGHKNETVSKSLQLSPSQNEGDSRPLPLKITDMIMKGIP
jgi:hypothetical protein